ncbi:hypothetical protein M569_15545, partial [Genlisea aurea]
ETEENQPKPLEQVPVPLQCPRCGSLDTKFRYFNNHNFAQPRHYCRTCKRQWTAGGNLRNIPAGGKTKQTEASSSRTNHTFRLAQTSLREGEPGKIHQPPQSFERSNLQWITDLP